MRNLKLPHAPALKVRRYPLSRRQRGLTLIEFMVSIAIGLILVAGISVLIAQQSSTQAELEKSSRQIENGRYAMQLLQEDIQMAGYFGEYSAAGTLAAPTSLPNPCETAVANMASAMPFAIQGYDATIGTLANAASATPSGCGLNALNYVTGTDILVVRRVDPTVVVEADIKAGQHYLQTGLSASGLEFSTVLAIAADDSELGSAFNLLTKTGTPGPLRKYVVNVYFVSPCSKPTTGAVCSLANTDDGGVSVPTLKRLELSAGAFVMTPLVEGIENMQIDYGFDTNGDGSSDVDLSTAGAVADWVNVTTLRMNLLARNNGKSADFTDTKIYNLGLAGPTTAKNDNFKRRVFSALIRVVNPSSRRDQ